MVEALSCLLLGPFPGVCVVLAHVTPGVRCAVGIQESTRAVSRRNQGENWVFFRSVPPRLSCQCGAQQCADRSRSRSAGVV